MWCNISDEGVKELNNCHNICITFTYITDECAKTLGNWHTIYTFSDYSTSDHTNESKDEDSFI